MKFPKKSITIIVVRLKLAKNIITEEKSMRNSFKKLIAVTLAFLMVVATLVVPNLTAKAEGTEGYVTMANDFDWSGLGDYSNIYVYANWDDTLTPESSLNQEAAFYQWMVFVVLERNEDNNYVVTALKPQGDGCVLEAPLGEGKLVIVYQQNDLHRHKESTTFFDSLQVGDVLTPSTYWENIADSVGALSTPITFKIAEEGSVGPTAPEETEEEQTSENDATSTEKDAQDSDKADNSLVLWIVIAAVVIVLAVVVIVIVAKKRKK